MSYRQEKGCAHPVMLKESSLIDCVRDSLKAYIGNIASLEALLTGIDQSSINQALAKEYSDHITDNERRLEQVLEFKARLYESLVGGMLTKEEYASYKAKYTKQAEDIRESIRVLKENSRSLETGVSATAGFRSLRSSPRWKP